MNSFLDALGGIPAPLYLLALTPVVWYVWLRRYRPEATITTFGGRPIEWTAIYLISMLILFSLFLLSAFRIGLAHFAH